MVLNPRFVAERIAGARLIEPSSGNTAWFHWYGRARAILEEVGKLLANVRVEQASFDRVLATVLFTDIVDSTATAATMGDAKWRDLLEEHDRIAKGAHRPVPRHVRPRHRRRVARDVRRPGERGPLRRRRSCEAVRPLGIEIRAGLHTGEIEYGARPRAASVCTSAPGWAPWPERRRSGSPRP